MFLTYFGGADHEKIGYQAECLVFDAQIWKKQNGHQISHKLLRNFRIVYFENKCLKKNLSNLGVGNTIMESKIMCHLNKYHIKCLKVKVDPKLGQK